MSVGAAWPLGNALAISSWPWTDSTSSRNELLWVSPLEKFSRPAVIATSSTSPPSHTTRGPRATRSATPRHAPCVSSDPLPPKRGTNGQNGRRPTATSRAGRNVSITRTATAMPIAPIGPRPAVPLTSASESESSAAHTVRPDAKIAGPARRSASSIASCLSSWRRSSSR